MQDHVGFSGSRHGMSKAQQRQLFELLRDLRGEDGDGQQFHHGACVGADAGAARVAQAMGYVIHAHPSNIRATKDRRSVEAADVVHDPLPTMERNEAIVVRCATLIAAPLSPVEDKRSGTWATVRRARKIGRRVHILTNEEKKA